MAGLLIAERLNAFLTDLEKRPYRLGDCDCWLAVADWLQVLTGKDYAAEFRGRYASIMDASHMVRQRGGMAEVLEEKFGHCRINPDEADAGDIGEVWAGLAAFDKGGAICVEPRHWAAKCKEGSVVIFPAHVVQAFRVTE